MSKTASPEYFYRIEHKETQIGPYRNDYAFVAELGYKFGDCFLTGYHKTPDEDGLGNKLTMFGKFSRFGFNSIEKLKAWWTDKRGVYEAFEEKGYQIVRYEVDELFSSSRQSVARVGGMKNPIVISIDELFS